MSQSFEIKFDFPLAHSDLTISLRATAELHHSDPYYVVDNFRFSKGRKKTNLSLLPRQEIRNIEYDGNPTWVHMESERPSLLSIAIGKAIDENGE